MLRMQAGAPVQHACPSSASVKLRTCRHISCLLQMLGGLFYQQRGQAVCQLAELRHLVSPTLTTAIALYYTAC